jgi:hypothetical protein
MSPQVSVLGNLRIAGALILDQNNPDFPVNPKPGTLVIKGLDLYAFITVGSIQAWYPIVQQAKGTANYIHTQVNPLATWTVTHNLNTPAGDMWYQIQDQYFDIIGPHQLVPIDNNSFQLIFTTPINGTCLVVGTEQLLVDNAIIGDGSVDKIHHYANQRLNFVAGIGVNLTFDDNAKSITINSSGAGAADVSAVVASLATETAARIAAVSTVSTAVTTEATARANADTTLTTNLTNEVSARTAADTTTNAAIAAEVIRAQAAETSLAASVSSESSARVSAILAEVVARDAAIVLASAGDLTKDFAANIITVAGDIMPLVTSTLTTGNKIGSPTMRFKAIYVDEAHLSVNTLYLGTTPVLGTTADVINIAGDINQSINMHTSGTGVTYITSEHGVEMSTTGAASDVSVIASGLGSYVRFTSATGVIFTAPIQTFNGDLSVTGNELVGGNLTVTGSLTVNGSVTTVNSTTVTTKDNIIEVNKGQVGTGVSAGLAGISVDRGDGAKYQMVFDESVQMFRVGMTGQLETLASQPYVATNYAPIVHSHSAATTAASGFMSAADKTKLDSVAAIADAATVASLSTAVATLQSGAGSNTVTLTNGGITSSSFVATTTAADQVADSFAISAIRSAKYVVQISSGSAFQLAEILCIHDGSVPYMTELGDVFTGASALAVFSATIVGGNLQLLVTPAVANITIKVIRTTISI